jgi:hypothetical protein
MIRARGVLVAGLLCLIAGAAPAGAGASAGTCVINLRFDFGGLITNNSPPMNYTMSGTGACQTSAGLGKSIQMAGAGTAIVARCPTLVMSGSYVVDFFPDPAPSGSNGEFNFDGNASVGLANMRGSNPTFVGAALLAGGGLVGCASGKNTLTFSMVLAFIDP